MEFVRKACGGEKGEGGGGQERVSQRMRIFSEGGREKGESEVGTEFVRDSYAK